MRAIAPNTDYFKPIILKFKTFIYNTNSNVIHEFCMHGGQYSSRRGEVTPSGKNFLNIDIMIKNTSEYAKLKV